MAVIDEIAPFWRDSAFDPHACLRVDGLACLRGEVRVFDALSFTLEAGAALMVRGPNGSGKSSLLRLLAGLVPPAGGTMAGLASLPMHYLGHADGLKPLLSVAETIKFDAGLAGRDDFAVDVLPLLGLPLPGWHMVSDLSAGQKRRLSMARLLVDPRPLWLLDEPLTALDDAGRALVGSLAAGHLEKGGMIIAASHEALPFAASEISLGAA